jgi:signal transduction histidine kinase
VSYIAGVVGVSALASALFALQSPPAGIQVILIWTLAALAGEFMVFPTATGRAHINLVTTVHLAMILALGPGEMVAVLWVSRGLAKFILKRQVWYRALFNVAQGSGAVILASIVFDSLGGTPIREFTIHSLIGISPAFLTAAVTYVAVNTFSVSGIVALTSADTIWRAWRENFGYAAELASTAALILFAPFITLCYVTMGAVGLVIFLLPTIFIRAMSVRYIAMRQAQQNLISSERLAAKAEIAAEVGHEINNYLTAVSGNIQLLARKGERVEIAEMQQRLQRVMGELDRITSMSTGLVEFSSKEARLAPTRITELVRNTVRFIRPQSRFDSIEFRLELDERLGEVPVDPVQIQQVIMNLLINAANAMSEANSRRSEVSIWVRLHDVTGNVEITVADSGPGVPPELRDQIFEPGFTTSPAGRGFGLSTTYRIVANHQGTISVDDSPAGGALFRVLLPIPNRKAA